MAEPSAWTIPGFVPLPPVSAPDGSQVVVTLSETEHGDPIPYPREWTSSVRGGVWSHPPVVRDYDALALADYRNQRLWVCVTWAGRPVGACRVRVAR